MLDDQIDKDIKIWNGKIREHFYGEAKQYKEMFKLTQLLLLVQFLIWPILQVE